MFYIYTWHDLGDNNTMLATYGLHLENIFCKKFYIKKCNSEPFCFLIKSVLCTEKRTQGKTLLIGSMPSLLTNQMTIPFNKLPCLDGSFLATEIFRFFAGLLVLKVSFWFKCSDLQWSLRRSVCKNLAEQSEHWTVKSSGKACSSRKWLQKASIVMWSVFWQPFNWQIITPFSDLSYHLHRLVDLICCWLKLHFSWCLTRLGRRL